MVDFRANYLPCRQALAMVSAFITGGHIVVEIDIEIKKIWKLLRMIAKNIEIFKIEWYNVAK